MIGDVQCCVVLDRGRPVCFCFFNENLFVLFMQFICLDNRKRFGSVTQGRRAETCFAGSIRGSRLFCVLIQ